MVTLRPNVRSRPPAGRESDPPQQDPPRTPPPAPEPPARPTGVSGLRPRTIALVVAAVYFVGSLLIFRDVLTAIPSVLRGDAVIAGDELVPF